MSVKAEIRTGRFQLARRLQATKSTQAEALGPVGDPNLAPDRYLELLDGECGKTSLSSRRSSS
jgi:hypothetical protein